MNILGVGAWELVAILLIMLVFAGPKRMIHWSYVLGQHVAKFRKIWSETVDMVQKEFDEAGVDIKLPKEPPTRKSLNSAVTDAVKPMTKPVQDSLDEVKKDMDAVKEVSNTLNNKTKATASNAAKKDSKPLLPQPSKPKPAAKPASAPEPVPLGTWSDPDSAARTNGKTADLGAWSRAVGRDGAKS
ncbi:MAG: hypothetical protein OXG78_10060 [Chloroflexi bacterium]|nr:hypothetical protein [Chloroflexota bacterium]